ncbi:MAG: response regulator transcription factor, partial [Rhodothermales bacterium]|nr:response regulator transcription factor [Rhodothermales bacterium]
TESALVKLTRERPDLCIVEVAVPGLIGLDFLKEMKRLRPETRILVLSRYDEMRYAAAAIHSGAGGYVMKREPIEVFLEAVRRVLVGEVYVSDAVNRQLLQSLSDPQPYAYLPSEVLSNREKEIFRMMGRGLSAREIAARLKVSRKTVDTHRLRMKKKLHIDSITEMTCLAVWWVDREGG